MGNTYLNKKTRFKCGSGNAVWFKPQFGDKKVIINGEETLVDNCKLSLIGTPHPGQCMKRPPNPATGVPEPCMNLVNGKWSNKSNVKVSGKNILNNKSSIKCACGGVLSPFKPTYKMNNVNDDIDNIVVNIDLKSQDSKVFMDNKKDNAKGTEKVTVSQFRKSNLENTTFLNPTDNSSENIEPEFERQEQQYAICDYKNCSKKEECQYIKTSFEVKEKNESKNAQILTDNIARDKFDLYAKDCGMIASTLFGKETYSIAHHHIIPVNQCFKQYPELVKMANYYNYDINNAWNGICLPTMNRGYDKQPLSIRLEIAFMAMKKLGKQWHKGGHAYAGKVNEIEKIGREVDDLFKGDTPLKDYKSSVDEYLEVFRNKLVEEGKCWCEDYEHKSKKFCDTMNHICKIIAQKLRKFETNPKEAKGFFVSKIALYYAYYDILKEYQDIIFEGEVEYGK